MHKTGSLKKKGRRNLKTVSGQTGIPYTHENDIFDGGYHFLSGVEEEAGNISKKAEGSVSVSMSRILSRSNGRVTRDPAFHQPYSEGVDDIDIDINTSEVGEFGFQRPPTTSSFLAYPKQQEMNDPNWSFPISPIMIKILRLIIKTAFISLILPWKWNKVTRRIDLMWTARTRQIQRIGLLVFLAQTTCIFMFQLNIVRLNFSASYASHRFTFMHLFVAFWYILHVFNVLNALFFGEGMRRYINALLEINEKYTARFVVDKGMFKEEKRWMVLWVVPEFWIHIPINVLNFVRGHALFFYLYSYINQPDNPWYWLVPGALHEFFVIAQCVSIEILYVWTLFCHANSNDFWLTEIHKNNDSGQTTEELRDPQTAIDVYKTLLVLGTLFNDAMSTFSIAICKVIGAVGFTICAYVLFRTTSALFVAELPDILAFVAGTPSCSSIAIIVLSLSAKVYDLGISFLTCWGKTRHKNLRCILMGCPALKVKLGSFYSIMGKTLVTFWHIVIGYLIDCIITFT